MLKKDCHKVKRAAIDFANYLPWFWILQYLIFWKVKVYYDKKRMCWARKVVVKGEVINGFFYPCPNLLITYRIEETFSDTEMDAYVKKLNTIAR